MTAFRSVLFVCLGNICRSPSAEAVMRKKAASAQLDLRIDSAGTGGWHVGAPPDSRSVQVGVEKEYDFSGISCRKVAESDFEDFDLIIAMDERNLNDLQAICPTELQHKVHLLMSFTESEYAEVPDPYYGGKKGFELVLEMIEAGCDGLISHIQSA